MTDQPGEAPMLERIVRGPNGYVLVGYPATTEVTHQVTYHVVDGPLGGNWEGGKTTPDGRRWTHVPWAGWVEARPSPFLPAPRRLSWWRRFTPPWRRR